MYIYIHIYMYTHVYTYTYTDIHTHKTHIYIYIYIYIYICTYHMSVAIHVSHMYPIAYSDYLSWSKQPCFAVCFAAIYQ